MNYTPLDLSDRIRNLKSIYKTLPVPMENDPYTDKKFRHFRSGDRWITLGYLRGWRKHFDADTTRLRTAYAEAEELYQAQPVILDEELLLGHLYLPDYNDDELAEYNALCDAFVMSSHTLRMSGPRKDHIGLDFDKLLRLGILGLIDEVKSKLRSLDLGSGDIYPGYEEFKKYELYQSIIIELEAVLDLASRYAREARRIAELASDKRRAELLRMADVIERVPALPATSFYEAVQSVHFFLSGLFGLYPICRPDRYLYSYYKHDIENGLITKELAQELIDNFCLGISDRVFSRSACGFIVGGTAKDGTLVENDLTYMFLTALEHLKLPDPNGALAVNENTCDDILCYAAKILSTGTTHPAFYNDSAIIDSLVNNYGVKKEDAVCYIHSTCAEITVVGKTKGHTTPFNIELPRILCDVVKADSNFSCLDSLFEKLADAVYENIINQTNRYFMRMLEASRIGNEAIRISALIDDCVELGKGLYDGGEKYTFLQPICIGFATTVDSLLAIDELVYKKKRLTLAEFSHIVENNFRDNESLRSYIVNKLAHYGNDDRRADAIAARLGKLITDVFMRKGITGGKYMMPGTFSYVNHAYLGAEMGATFDGRRAGYSYSDGCSAVQGRDAHGPTAMIKSLTSWEQSRLLGGMVVNIKFGGSNLVGEENEKRFVSLLRAFIARGGIELQVNSVDRAALLAALEHPEEHGDLMVRIGGFSDYFVRLKPSLQKEIIDRTEY